MKEKSIIKKTTLIHNYSKLEAWLYDTIANRASNLQLYFFEQGNLTNIFAEVHERYVLDVGCGGGQTAIRLKEIYPHLSITGIDLSELMIARARKRTQRKGFVLKFQIADAQALPFPDESFDVVYSLGSVKHWPDPLLGIAECWRVLKQGGELLLTDNISDATREQVIRFYEIAGFPKLFKKPVTSIMYKRMFRPACPMETYYQIARQLKMPLGTVSQLQFMPTFLFRTQKPLSSF